MSFEGRRLKSLCPENKSKLELLQEREIRPAVCYDVPGLAPVNSLPYTIFLQLQGWKGIRAGARERVI